MGLGFTNWGLVIGFFGLS